MDPSDGSLCHQHVLLSWIPLSSTCAALMDPSVINMCFLQARLSESRASSAAIEALVREELAAALLELSKLKGEAEKLQSRGEEVCSYIFVS